MRRTLPILAAVGLSGCWPALKVSEPRVHFTVTDESGAPVGGAKVMMTKQAVPLGWPELIGEFLTDSDGVFDRFPNREWLIIVPLPDVTTGYAWTYCVEKAGYRAVMGPLEQSHKPTAVVLEPSARESSCEFSADRRSLLVVEND